MQVYDICPLPKPRMTQRDRWAKRPAVLRYRAFCDEVRLRGMTLPQFGCHVTFVLPMPDSWSKKKRAEYIGRPHQQKPDADNLLKALMDAIYDDDCAVWDVRVTKLWGEGGRIQLNQMD
ncbi:RusA family crossover junction endodeoxyribonuclease [Pantoea sp. BAV 3049]|uniref:RusA family crossover junction endodeoxyribonuclease n=1 Tax=Pantoea sp. BAV 3049 TaxID=2654188 RepID=UPI00131BC526|nr:RusA family crossover junction endodeoxyribonuclease [Pantoea sp. BAV 3049]